MTKIEELRDAYASSTQGAWDFVVADNAESPHSIVVDSDGEELLKHRYGVTMKAQHDVSFIHIAHNLTPTLLEAADLLLWAFRNLDDEKCESLRDQIRDVLERLE